MLSTVAQGIVLSEDFSIMLSVSYVDESIVSSNDSNGLTSSKLVLMFDLFVTRSSSTVSIFFVKYMLTTFEHSQMSSNSLRLFQATGEA